MCGLDKYLPLFNFVGSFSYLHEHTKLLLTKLELWEKYGAETNATGVILDNLSTITNEFTIEFDNQFIVRYPGPLFTRDQARGGDGVGGLDGNAVLNSRDYLIDSKS